jgi:drug/metabolite transporter (DMT)-like permease
MFHNHIGELAALTTAACWTITAVAFESAGKKVGSLSVNLIRLILGLVLLSIFNLISRGVMLPIDASPKSWLWLSISGLIGFVIGDLFLFQAFVEIGSRISMLIMSTVPPITAIMGFLLMGEKISLLELVGMLITMAGIAMVVLTKGDASGKVKLSHPAKGLTFAFIGALGQAFGLVFSKLGMGSYNAFAATQIRIIAGLLGFVVVLTLTKKWPEFKAAFKDATAMGKISIGAFFGPFLGVSFSLVAVQHTATGIVSTITSITPILIIPPAIFIMKEKVTTKEIFGAAITLLGVALLFV